MKTIFLAGLAGLLCMPVIAAAEPVTRTRTIDTPRYEGSRTTTIDREAGTIARDGTLTRLSDDAVATRSYDRQRTDTGVTASGATTRFNGDTRSFDYNRGRTARGYRAEGSATGFNDQTYDYRAGARRAPNGYVRGGGVRNGDGDLVAGRRVAVRQGPYGGVNRRATRFGRR